MKKLILLFATTIASYNLFAQNNNDVIPPSPIERSVFSFGIKAGFGHGFIIPYQNYMFLPAWDGGISAVYSPSEHAAVGMDVLFSREGMKASSAEETFDVTLNYIRVPMKAIYFFNRDEDDFRPKVALGPSLGFLLDASSNDLYKVFDFGANASLGFNYRVARATWFTVDAIYNQGFLDYREGNTERDMTGTLRLEIGVCVGF